jgi:hypothetical protein
MIVVNNERAPSSVAALCISAATSVDGSRKDFRRVYGINPTSPCLFIRMEGAHSDY